MQFLFLKTGFILMQNIYFFSDAGVKNDPDMRFSEM